MNILNFLRNTKLMDRIRHLETQVNMLTYCESKSVSELQDVLLKLSLENQVLQSEKINLIDELETYRANQCPSCL